MTESTTSSMTIQANPAVVLDVIADFQHYHVWAENIVTADILTEDDDGWPKTVRFELDGGVLRDSYVLAYEWDVDETGAGKVSWDLVESTVIRTLEGSYELSDAGSHTDVTYSLRVDVNIPVAGVLRRRAEKSIIDQALRGLRQRAEG